MSDPQRLLDDPDASPLARSLIASAAEDGPTAERRSAIAKKLGLAALLATTSTSTEAGVVAGALWLKLGALLAVLGGVTALVIFVPRWSSPSEPPTVTSPAHPAVASTPPPPPASPAMPSTTTTIPANPPTPPSIAAPSTPMPSASPSTAIAPHITATRTPAAPATKPKEAAVAVPSEVAITPPAPVVEPPPVVAAPPVAVDARRLAAEVAVLDRARAALRGNDVAGALAALDEHDRDFADGALGTEAEVVRIEAWIQRGDRAIAAERARAFLASHPKSPLAKRVHSLLDHIVGEAPKETP